jgi:hypothetical protein
MIHKSDPLHRRFTPLLEKTLQTALAHRIAEHFPRIGGPRIVGLCAEMILEVLHDHVRPFESLHTGQLLWLAISVDDPPTRMKRTLNTNLVPVILDLSTEEDVHAILDREPPKSRLERKCVRLCKQAFEQRGLLSNIDLAEILTVGDPVIAHCLTQFEKRTQTVVPRRATVHDVGSGVTHKRIICIKRYVEGKPSHQIARETFHSLEAVDRYLAQFDRVRHCRTQNMTPEQTAFTLSCTPGLVAQYLAIDDELRKDTDD